MVAMKRIFGVLILGITVFDSWLGWLCVKAAHHTYPFSVPFVVTIVICSCVGLVAVGMNTRATSLIHNGLVMLSLIPYFLAVGNWPGGDDGPGMGMVFIIGPTLLAATALAFISTIRLLEE